MDKNEIRCPEHKFRLFGKVVVENGTNLMQIKCRECTKEKNKKLEEEGSNDIVEVFHYWDLAGNRIKTEIKYLKKEETNECSNNDS